METPGLGPGLRDLRCLGRGPLGTRLTEGVLGGRSYGGSGGPDCSHVVSFYNCYPPQMSLLTSLEVRHCEACAAFQTLLSTFRLHPSQLP